MPFNGKVEDISKLLPAEVVKVELSTQTSPASPELVISNIDEGGRYRREAIETTTVYGPRPIGYRHILEFAIVDVNTQDEAPPGTKKSTKYIVYELATLPAAFVRITFRNGSKVTLQSGTDNVPVMSFTDRFEERNGKMVFFIRGVGETSVEQIT